MSSRTAMVYLALGSNKGNRLENLQGAVRGLEAHEAISDVRPSPVYEAEAHTLAPEEVQPAYLNAIIALKTGMEADELLDACQVLEDAAGRERDSEERWQPRVLDIDLLVYGRETRRTECLTLPHPRLGERRFVLRPLVDLEPNLYIPLPFDATANELLARCPDTGALRRTSDTLVS